MPYSKEEIEKLELAIKAAQRDASREITETVNILSCHGYNYYRLRNRKTKECHLSNKEDPRVLKSAQAAYAKAFLTVAQKVLKDVKEKNNTNYKEELCSVFEGLHPARKLIVIPYILSQEQFADNWQKQTWNIKNSYEPPQGDLKTLKGETVRSKSEQLIANLLFHKEIPYLYEKPLILPGGHIRFPDFTILNKRTQKEYILEHFGKMDDPDYRKKAWKKIQDYNRAGYVLGENFIFTFEETDMPLNTEMVEIYIKTYFQ